MSPCATSAFDQQHTSAPDDTGRTTTLIWPRCTLLARLPTWRCEDAISYCRSLRRPHRPYPAFQALSRGGQGSPRVQNHSSYGKPNAICGGKWVSTLIGGNAAETTARAVFYGNDRCPRVGTSLQLDLRSRDWPYRPTE